MNDNPTMVISTRCATVIASTDAELSVFVAPFDALINKIYFTNAADIASSDANFSTLSFQKKGSLGTATSEIGSKAFSTATASKNVPLDVGALDKDHRFIPKGTAVTYKKADSGDGLQFTNPLFTTVFKRA